MNANKQKRTIILELENYEWLKILEKEQAGRLFVTLFKKYLGLQYEIDPDILVPFTVLSNNINRYNERWRAECERRSELGKKGNQIRWAAKNIAIIAEKEKEEEEEKEKDILEIKKFFLFEKFICPVQSEFERFLAHYEKNGWVDGNGVPITNKLACARNWKPEASVGRLDIRSAKAWEVVYNILEDREKSELMVTDLYGFNLKNNTLIIHCTKQLYEFVESNMDDGVGAAIRKEFNCQMVEYKIVTR